MKTLSKTLFGATAATALAVAGATPAQADVDAGDVIAGVAILGGIAAIAAAASDNDDRYDDRYRSRGYDRDYYRGDYRGRHLGPQQAVNQCSAAAVRDASRYGPGARVTQITDVDRNRDGYEVEGRLIVRDDYGWRDRRWNRGRDFDQGSFTCRIRYGRIDRLRVRGIG